MTLAGVNSVKICKAAPQANFSHQYFLLQHPELPSPPLDFMLLRVQSDHSTQQV